MRTKALTIIMLLFFSAGVLATHQVGRLYPFVFLIILPLGILGVVLCDTRNQIVGQANHILLLILAVAIAYRVYIYSFPATVIGLDLDTHIVLVSRLMETGSVSVIDRFFYDDAPLFYIFSALFGLISGTSAKGSFVIYPIIFPIIGIFGTYILSRNFTPTNKARQGLLATCLVAVATVSSYYSFAPIPQSLSVLQLIVILILVTFYFERSRKICLIPIFLVAVSSIYTHKIVVLLVVFIFSSHILISILNNIIFNTKVNIGRKKRDTTLLAATLGVALVLQYFYITHFGRTTIFKLFGLGSFSISGVEYVFSSVKPILTPHIYKTISDKMHLIVSLPIAGLGWLHLFRSQRKNDTELWVLTSSAVTVIFIAVALFNPFLTSVYTRYFLFGSIFIFILVSYFLISRSNSKYLIKGVQALFLMIIISQIFTATAIPDNPTQNRKYLTSAEVEAWDHSLSTVPEDIYTDYFYADHITPTTAANDIQYSDSRMPEGPPAIQSYGRSILNGTIPNNGKYILQRKNIQIYYTAYGKWRLDWRMGDYLERNYSKVYSDSAASLYVNSS